MFKLLSPKNVDPQVASGLSMKVVFILRYEPKKTDYKSVD